MVNLINQLSELDKEILKNYICIYSKIDEDEFIGVEEYLEYWNEAKQKLYKALGNQLIVKIPFNFHKDEQTLKNEFEKIVDRHNFISHFRAVLWRFDAEIKNHSPYYCIEDMLYNADFFLHGLPEPVTILFKDDEKPLVLSKGIKYMRAINKIFDRIKSYITSETDCSVQNIEKTIEDYRIRLSEITNYPKDANIVISIHPMDFLTMSDNAANWTSCMSWTDRGCHLSGSIEMMNSNNVVCCYLESLKPYCFIPEDLSETDCNNDFFIPELKDIQNKEAYTWNNKLWRSLFYVTKPILVSGKAYPYENIGLSGKILAEVRKLVSKNLGWDYENQFDHYNDMKNMYSYYDLEDRYHSLPEKGLILFDSKGMYNDFLWNGDYTYLCCRNSVKKNKLISYSGKTKCVCCPEPIIVYNEDFYTDPDDEEEDRYFHTNSQICGFCESSRVCHYCGYAHRKKELYKISSKDGSKIKIVCKNCLKYDFDYCSCCEKVFNCEDIATIVAVDKTKEFFLSEEKTLEKIKDSEIHICYDCLQKHCEKFSEEERRKMSYNRAQYLYWSGIVGDHNYYFYSCLDDSKRKKMKEISIKNPDMEEIMKLIK